MLLGSEGLALQQLHRYDEAIAAFKEAVRTRARRAGPSRAPDPGADSAANRHKRGARRGREAARAKFPDDSGVLYQLGAALDRAGRRDEAETDVPRRSSRSDPLDASALNYLGYMFAEHAHAARRGGHADPARAEGRARQSVVPRQPGLGLRAAGQARSRRPAADAPPPTSCRRTPSSRSTSATCARSRTAGPTRSPPGSRRSPATAIRSIARRSRRRSTSAAKQTKK